MTLKTTTRFLLLAAAAWLAGKSAWATGCMPFIEEFPGETSAILRPHRTAFLQCRIDEQQYQTLIVQWLRSRAPNAPAVTSLALGRAVNLPWIARFMADTAMQTPGWSARIGHASIDEQEKLARPILRHPALLQRIAAPFANTTYEVLGLSHEKLLFGSAKLHSSIPAGGDVKVPYDAQLWLRLGPRSRQHSER